MDDPQFERYHRFTPYRRTNDETLGRALERMVGAYGFRHKLQEARIRLHWDDWLGATIAKYTESIELREGKLYVRIPAAGLRQELFYRRERLMERINAELGEQAVSQVVLLG